MAVDVSILPSTMNDVKKFAPTVRPVEVDEVFAATGETVSSALFRGLMLGAESWTVRFNGKIALMWGVVPQGNDARGKPYGVGWLLTNDLVEKKPMVFWKLCLAMLPSILERWSILANAIDIRHKQALNWARHLGFDMQIPQPIGQDNRLFVPFTLTRESFLCARQ